MPCNSNIIWDISCISAVFYRMSPSVQLGLLTTERQRAILNNVWYYIHPSTDVHGTGNHAPRRNARHAIILISMNILFIRLRQYALVLATDSGNGNTNLCSENKKKWSCTNSIQMRILQTYFLLNESAHKLNVWYKHTGCEVTCVYSNPSINNCFQFHLGAGIWMILKTTLL